MYLLQKVIKTKYFSPLFFVSHFLPKNVFESKAKVVMTKVSLPIACYVC